jgi:spore coat assembly protein
MSKLKIGDIVGRKSYNSDILFKVVDIKNEGGKETIVLRGICYRLEADAPESDLVLQPESYVREYSEKVNEKINSRMRNLQPVRYRYMQKKKIYRDLSVDNGLKFQKPGKVLHIDGDSDYLNTCLEKYKNLGIEAVGVHVKERDQPSKVYDLLVQHKPDILVLTGHDGVIKDENGYSRIDNYRTSKYFVDAVKEARRYDSNIDGLVIFAGACQSMYHKIIEAGANYASAPYRVLIHALDPVYICKMVALTGIDKIISPEEVISTTITGYKGIGGIETRGKYRNGYPSEPYK